jgi:hypothetical protein
MMPRASRRSFATTSRVRWISSRSSVRNVPLNLRPTRSPSHLSKRNFTKQPSLLLISRPSVRPQLPFLYPSVQSHAANVTHIGRFVSTEVKLRWRARIRNGLKNIFYLGTFFGLGTFVATGIRHTKQENEHPTPPDWSFWSRWYLRTACWFEEQEAALTGIIAIDWGSIGWYYAELLRRLEDEEIDGSNLLAGDTLIEGVGRTGLDISMKSDSWRMGYYEALMGAARAAEHLDGMARRKGEDNGKVYPWDSVPGPNNPRPKPMAWDKDGAHKNVPYADQCEDAYPQPETFYMKILTTQGFVNAQRLDAALAYADWCEFKGLHKTTGDVLDWAIDIAASGIPEEAGQVLDPKTHVINDGKDQWVTRNVLKASTALAVHHARNGHVKDAFSLFLGVLRARRNLPPEPIESQRQRDGVKKQPEGLMAYVNAMKSFLVDTPYPSPPPSGDERPFHTLKEACEEVAVMTYLGEILFATSDKERERGLGWTRDSVEGAEAILWVMDEQGKHEGSETCKECLATGLVNWKDMTSRMMRLATRKKEQAEQSRGFLGLHWGKEALVRSAAAEAERWREEQAQIELRRQKTLPLLKQSLASR